MSANGKPTTPKRRAAQIAENLQLSDEARQMLTDDLSPRAFVDRLANYQLYVDAIRFLVHAMLMRRAVWWGCLCVWEAHRDGLLPTVESALEAVVRWVQQPTEEHRRAAQAAAQAAGIGTSAGCLATAVAVAGGDTELAQPPDAEPGEDLAARMAGGAVLTAAAECEGTDFRASCRRMLQLGLEVAAGENPPTATHPEKPSAVGPDTQTPGDRVDESLVLHSDGDGLGHVDYCFSPPLAGNFVFEESP